MFDLGLERNDMTHSIKVGKKISQIESNFDLVMIAEKIEESLVLMADLLCIPLYYVASLKVNARKENLKAGVHNISSKYHALLILSPILACAYCRVLVLRWTLSPHKYLSLYTGVFHILGRICSSASAMHVIFPD